MARPHTFSYFINDFKGNHTLPDIQVGPTQQTRTETRRCGTNENNMCSKIRSKYQARPTGWNQSL